MFYKEDVNDKETFPLSKIIHYYVEKNVVLSFYALSGFCPGSRIEATDLGEQYLEME